VSVLHVRHNLSSILEEYHDLADVFDKAKADMLAPHWLYNLKINLNEDATPLLGQMYSLSPTGLVALREFIDEHLATGFIRPLQSPYGAPVLFAKKKDRGLCLCVDFRGLNKITKKDHYPLPPITDLLDSFRKAHIYTKSPLPSPMETSTPWLSIPTLSLPLNLITTLTTKNSWPSLRLFKSGDIILKVPELRSTLLLTTRI